MSDPERDSSGIGAALEAPDVSRAYRRTAREEPPPHLDDAIRAAARRGAGSGPRRRGRSTLRRWAAPIAIAATLVVGVSVAFLAVDRPDAPMAPPTSLPQPAIQSESRRALPPELESAVRAKERTQGDDAGQAAPPIAQHAPPAATSAAPREARPSRERQSRDEAARVPAEPPPATYSAPVPRRDPAPAPSTAPAPSAAVPAPAAETRALKKAFPRSDATSADGEERLSPEMWLQRIREMRARGELAAAQESLKAFRHRYPDYPLPDDLLPEEGAGK